MPHHLAAHISRRILYLVPIWIGISLLTFILSNLAPGDPAEMILRQRADFPTADAVEKLRGELGLDRPFPERYAHWLTGAVRGDIGNSYATGAPAVVELAEAFPATLQLAAGALLFASLIALPLGALAAARRGTAVDHLIRMFSLLGASVPSFVLAYALILIIAVSLHLLPVAGSGGWRYLALPVLTLGIGELAALTRLTRASVLEVMGEDFIRTARAKGLPPGRVLLQHTLRNALIPLVTLSGIRAGKLLGGAVIVETIYARPGIGKLIVDSIHARDYPVIQAFVLFTGTLFVIANLAVDISYAWLDPRIRLGGRR